MIEWIAALLPATAKAVLGLTAFTGSTTVAVATGLVISQIEGTDLDPGALTVGGGALGLAFLAIRVAFKLMDRVETSAQAALARADAAEARSAALLERAQHAEAETRAALDKAAEAAREAARLAEQLANLEHRRQDDLARRIETERP